MCVCVCDGMFGLLPCVQAGQRTEGAVANQVTTRIYSKQRDIGICFTAPCHCQVQDAAICGACNGPRTDMQYMKQMASMTSSTACLHHPMWDMTSHS